MGHSFSAILTLNIAFSMHAGFLGSAWHFVETCGFCHISRKILEKNVVLEPWTYWQACMLKGKNALTMSCKPLIGEHARKRMGRNCPRLHFNLRHVRCEVFAATLTARKSPKTYPRRGECAIRPMRMFDRLDLDSQKSRRPRI